MRALGFCGGFVGAFDWSGLRLSWAVWWLLFGLVCWLWCWYVDLV